MKNYTKDSVEYLTVRCMSHWNNSMGFDECSAIIFEDGEFKTVSVEPDSWYNFDTEHFISLTPPDIRKIYQDKIDAEVKAMKERDERYAAESLKRLCDDCQITAEDVKTIQGLYDRENQNRIFRLLATKKFRSNFRLKLSEQIRTWLADEHPKYQTPLSAHQLVYV